VGSSYVDQSHGPAATDSLQGARFLRRELDKTSVVMRFFVVKNWHDTFH
jgi:hypothetical protein